MAGATGGTLTGGAGADIFVLGPASGPLQISDFEPGVDRLDLTRMPMLRSAAQLDLTTTVTGIEIHYGATVIKITSFDGQPLKATDLWPSGFDTPDRVVIPEGPVIRVTRGTPDDDILTLGAGRDTIRGLAGADRIGGGVGNDRIFGGAGKDKIHGEDGRDHLFGGRKGDTLKGGAGKDVFIFRSGGSKPLGNDQILDFTDGSDLIRINAPGVGYGDLTLSSLGNGDTLIDIGFGTITLTGVGFRALGVDDFLFF